MYWIGLLCILFASMPLRADMVVSFRDAESQKDRRHEYNLALLKLALEKTRSDYGNYRLQPVPAMNIARSVQAMKKNEYPNLVVELSYEDSYANTSLTYIPFPVDLGVVGYRICFTAPTLPSPLPTDKKRLQRYTIGQGIGWADVEILRHNGFRVMEVGNYESLFKMVAAGRFDLLCRGINELYLEYESHSEIPGLHYDSTLAIHYPLPRFFFIHQSNQLARERIHKGLLRAYKDGSLQRLWQKEYQSSIDQADLAHRTIIFLDNPLIRTLPKDYQQYLYDPLNKQFATPPQPKADGASGKSSPH